MYMTGLVVFNHVAAAIHAARSESAADAEPSVEMLLGSAAVDGFTVTLRKKF